MPELDSTQGQPRRVGGQCIPGRKNSAGFYCVDGLRQASSDGQGQGRD